MKIDYLRTSDNIIHSFDHELSDQEKIDFQNGILDGVEQRNPSAKPSVSTSELLKRDISFGVNLLSVFLEDNRNLAAAFTPEISSNLLAKFSNVERLARLGDIKSVKYLISVTELDAIFTEDRKDKYVSMCNQYLGL